jgi:hypothetical protein
MPAMSSSRPGRSGCMRFSEKNFDHLGILGGVRQAAFENLPAGIHDDDAVGDLIDESHQVLDDQERDSGPRQFLELLRRRVRARRD